MNAITFGRAAENAQLSPASPDGELLRLGAVLAEAVAREAIVWDAVAEDKTTESGYEEVGYRKAIAVSDEVSAICSEIESLRATTFPGLLVQMRAAIALDGGLTRNDCAPRNFIGTIHPAQSELATAAVLSSLAGMVFAEPDLDPDVGLIAACTK